MQSTWLQTKTSQPLKESNSADTLISDFQPLDLRDNTVLLFKSPSVAFGYGSSSTRIRGLITISPLSN